MRWRWVGPDGEEVEGTSAEFGAFRLRTYWDACPDDPEVLALHAALDSIRRDV
jgi:hypothetical protein